MVIDPIKAKELFLQALDHQQPAERDRFLCRACGDDVALRKQVDVLLAADARAGSFLEQGAVATIDQPSERIGTLIGPYKLLEQIGEGGMGVVYMAEQQQPVRRLVALKLVKLGMDSKQVIARFEAERQALAMMDHPNIAKVHDAGTTETGRPYFSMELVRGIPINEFCNQQKLTVHQRLELFIQVCQAVQHAHQKGIIHRDLKPTNVLVTNADIIPLPKVIDFGIAKALGPALTDHTLHTGFAQLVGTPMYMSPEQAQMNHFGVDTRSDVYSLGVLLYELLTGTAPFDKEALSNAGLDEMRRIIREDDPPRPSTRMSTLNAQALSTISQQRNIDPRRISATLRGELDWIVMKALEKDRSRRYESASALAADIQRYLSDEPVLACPPTTMYRFQKFARKHKPVLATAAAIALCLILGTTVSAWQAARATTAEAQANENEAQAKASAQEAKEKAQEATQQRNEAQQQRDDAQRQRDEVKTLADKLAAKEQQLQRHLYASNMNLAKAAWDEGLIGRVKELLDQHRPKVGQIDLRGFEWHYLYRLCHSELLTLKSDGEGIAFSPDGKRLAGASAEKTVKVWDAVTGKELLALKGSYGMVAFSPDGKRLATASGDKTVKVWDAQTGQEILALKGPTSSVAFSPDGKRLASGGGKWASMPAPGELKVWDALTGQELLTLTGHAGPVTSVAFSPDGKRLAGASFGGFRVFGGVKVWEVQTGQVMLSVELAGIGPSVAFSPDGKRLAGSRQVWDAETGKELLSLKKDFPSGSVSSLDTSILDLSPDGNRLACAYTDAGVIKVRDAQTGDDLLTIKGHTGPVTSAVFSPDGKKLASRSYDGTIKVWDVTTSQEARSIERGGRGMNMSFSPDGKRVAFGINRNYDAAKGGFTEVEMKICDAQTGQEIFSIQGHADARGSRVAFSPDGKRLACAAGNKIVKVWDAGTGKELLALTVAGRIPVFSPDSKRLASVWNEGRDDGTVKVWDSENGQELLAFKAHSKSVNELAFSPDGKRLATHSQDSTVKVWNAQTGQEILTLKANTPQSIGGLAFSPDGKRLASTCLASNSYAVSAGGIGEVKVWDSETGEELMTLKGYTALVNSVVYSPDGKRLASASGNPTGRQSGEVKMWDAETGQELLTFKGGSYHNSVAFSPSGHWLASDTRGTVKIYDATPLPEKP